MLTSTHYFFFLKLYWLIAFSQPDYSAPKEHLPHPWAQCKGRHLFPAFIHTFLWFQRIWKRTLTMAGGKVDDVTLSSIFLMVTWKTESEFLKRKVFIFSLLWFDLFHLSWPEIRFCLVKTKMNTVWEFGMFYTNIVQMSPQESLVSMLYSFSNYFQRIWGYLQRPKAHAQLLCNSLEGECKVNNHP